MAATLRFLTRAASKHTASTAETPRVLGNSSGAKTPKTPAGSPAAFFTSSATSEQAPATPAAGVEKCVPSEVPLPVLLGRCSASPKSQESAQVAELRQKVQQGDSKEEVSAIALAERAREAFIARQRRIAERSAFLGGA
eukprot:TRINITY_DN1327_c0_g1_i1.p1 TRINITY_DN1327_c0_g1~~TRINITY_DN1327_c0_g1_i1.p1  ORF type:complete len:139 (-),score=29.40 TRINITY_DN1327_c0_g1_i1:424-840(-)